MPSFYKIQNTWYKECSSCGKVYESHAEGADAAYKEFRKNFSPRNNAKDGMESGCYRCRAIATMRIRFGIDVEAMLQEQNNKCMICEVDLEFNTGSNSISACVDHDHDTGETRGILCRHCNLGLGHFRDDIELIKKAIAYLEKHNG